MIAYSGNKYDFAIVGQGIAGTLLAYFLLKNGKNVLIIDQDFKGSSSKVAAGIVNPITGKNFVRSWRINEFMPFAKKCYEEMSKELGKDIYTMANIIRTLSDIEDENNWLARTSDESVSEYILNKADASEFEGKLKPAFNYGELTSTFHVNMSLIMDSFKIKWQNEKRYISTKFDYDLLVTFPTYFQYGDVTFEHIVFCEGYQAINNPFFSEIKMAPSKGEALLVKIPNAHFRKMYKDKIFIVHQFDDIYWVGSGYEWNSENDLPTEKQLLILSQHLQKMLSVPYEIVDHIAAIRPTMYTRRPIITIHQSIENMALFNGLGTKGASIGPFVANQLCNYLLYKDPKDLIL